MAKVPEAYYQFIMDYAPYVYVVPGSGPDQTWGRAAFAAAFAVDFLFEAYFDPEFDDRSSEIEAKIVELADWILTQQCTDSQKQAYGGFKSTENSTAFYSVDACRTVPALLKAYELTTNTEYLNSAKLAAGTFLYNMQHQPSQLGLHDRYYGGFARAVTLTDAWQQQMDVECLYGLIALKMLGESDPANKSKYETMISDATGFLLKGIEGFYVYYDPLPTGDGGWHRTGTNESMIFDDALAYALLGLYDNEGWSPTVQKTYEFVNAIGSSPLYPAYNPAVCWAGYIDVAARVPACDYYDCVTAGIAVAQKVYAAATAFATMVQNSLNISFATFLALTGVGIAVIVAAAAAMWSFANSMNSATASVQSFNETAAETPAQTRSIQRAGEAELYRRGVE